MLLRTPGWYALQCPMLAAGSACGCVLTLDVPCTAVIGAFGLTPFTLPATALTQVVRILELIFKGALAAMHWL